jgi:hypothetical protein
MIQLIKLHILFLAVAVFIAFALIPLDLMYFEHYPAEDIKKYYRDALSFESGKAWKAVFTWFLGFSCGRLMLRALAK